MGLSPNEFDLCVYIRFHIDKMEMAETRLNLQNFILRRVGRRENKQPMRILQNRTEPTTTTTRREKKTNIYKLIHKPKYKCP